MNARPRAHFFLKDAFLYYNRRRIFLAGDRSLALTPTDAAVLACLERGESELGVLAGALARLEIGGDPQAIARALIETHAAPASVLEIAEPLDVIEPQVIVCSFSAKCTVDSRALVGQLRCRGTRVLHVGLEAHVAGDPRSNVAVEKAVERGVLQSSFQFFQWARSLIGFYSRSVLVLTGTQDSIFFGDLAGSHYSVVCVEPDWPPMVRVQDLLGAQAFVRDPLASLQALFFALRMSPVKDFERMRHGSSSDLAALALYGIRTTSLVAYSSADHPLELQEMGRSPESAVPACVAKSSRRPSPGTGPLAVVADLHQLQPLADVLAVLHAAIQSTAITGLVLRMGAQWFGLSCEGNVVRAQPWEGGDAPRPVAAILFPGLLRHLDGPMDILVSGIPTVCYPTSQDHPLVEEAPDGWFARERDVPGWRNLLLELLDTASPRRAQVDAHSRECLRRWDLVRRVRELVRSAEEPPRA